MTDTTTDATTAAVSYFDAWREGDFARLRTVLADDVEFTGPLGRVTGAGDCVRGLEGLSRILTGIDTSQVFTAGPDDVLTWYDMSTKVAETVPVANWMHVENGRITQIRVAFDARGLAGGS